MSTPSTEMHDTQVLIVGAGPTGLVLALWLTRAGAFVRIIDKTSAPGTTSRALVVHAHTLELYRQLGLADTLVERAPRFVAANLWARGEKRARVPFGDMGRGLSPYPFALVFPQDEHEPVLIEALAEAGVEVEREVELVDFEDDGAEVRARLRGPGGAEETCTADYLVGCDGASSTVREQLEIGFPGGTYNNLFYVADVEASGPPVDGEVHVTVDEVDFLALFPLPDRRRVRLVGLVSAPAEGAPPPRWEDVSQRLIERVGIQVGAVNWFSTYHVHHRVAGQFRKGRVFLAGDAAHIHSPVGGQGMNTGIGDAVNLGWKIAEVLHERAAPALLDSYEPERIAFARQLVASTDRAFSLVTSNGVVARRVRVDLVPRVLPSLFGMRAVQRRVFQAISQIGIRYRSSPLSEGRVGPVHGGDRLPWVPPAGSGNGAGPGPGHDAAADNFSSLRSRDWQVHVYGEATAPLREVCGARGLRLVVNPWRPEARQAGLRQNAAYLVRPDGYVALADPEASPVRLDRYLTRCGLTLRPRRQSVAVAPLGDALVR